MLETLGLIILLGTLIYFWSRRQHTYWARRGVPEVNKYKKFFIGHTHMHRLSDRLKFNHEVYHEHGGSSYCGLYDLHSPKLFVGDPELIRHFLVVDFDSFQSRQSFEAVADIDRVWSDMMSSVEGEQWKLLRSILSPTFSSGKLHGMWPLVARNGDNLVRYCLNQKGEEIDMKTTMGRYTIDTMAACAFGLDVNCIENPDEEFGVKVKAYFSFTPKRILKFFLKNLLPRFIRRGFNIGMVGNNPNIVYLKKVAEQSIKVRKEGVYRGDFLDLIIEGSKLHRDAVDEICVISQAVMFLISGYDTTATTLAFTCWNLANNPEYQDKIREELKQNMDAHGGYNYKSVMECKLLEAIIMETLRMYPPAFSLERKCSKDYKLPNSDLTIKKGTVCVFPIWSIHRDPKYFQDPDKFVPERMLAENKDEIQRFTHMPFGAGPRMCVAYRFAMMEVKIALTKLLQVSQMCVVPGKEELKIAKSIAVLSLHHLPLLIKPLENGKEK
ncbi:unnamed protein product [Meganyctiphanes norvegica]|uniref:Cytochrome P450 n=1 Tax=Meganyctiphanes norvegica TaxID=48144 RepID=A0AAV2RKP9_MEGNR